MENKTDNDQREKDIQKMCAGILELSLVDDDYGDYCPLCFKKGRSIEKMDHNQDCIYLIAKDLRTGHGK